MFAATYMLMSTSLYGVTYWMPTLVKSYGVSSTVNGLLNMIPWALAALLLLWLPGKLKRERVVLRAMTVVAGVGVVCFASSLILPTVSLRFIALCLGGACIPLLYPCFWRFRRASSRVLEPQRVLRPSTASEISEVPSVKTSCPMSARSARATLRRCLFLPHVF